MSGADVHPTAIGTGVQPNTSSNTSSTDRLPESASNQPKGGFDDVQYPEQIHSGAVGYGPMFAQGATFEDKLTGIKEEIRGKLKHNPELVAQGKKRRTGELRHEEAEREDREENPFATPNDKQSQSSDSLEDSQRSPREQRPNAVGSNNEVSFA